MLLHALTTAAVALIYPVQTSDEILKANTTLVSSKARTSDNVHCLDVSLRHGRYNAVCLSEDEWQSVFDRVEANKSAARRGAAIALGWNNASPAFR